MAMLRSIFLTVTAVFILSACGTKRPLIPPKDIPAHEAKVKKKQERYQGIDPDADDDDAEEPAK